MTTTGIIEKRKSVRSFTGEPLKKNDAEAINQYVASLKQPFGGSARIALISAESGAETVKLGTYGVISKAKDFLALIYEPGVLAEENAGYLFEQTVLFCTSLGLGTCWLGGTFKKNDFSERLTIKEDEQFRIVSPVGYPAEKRTFLERVMRKGAGSDKRRAFEELFFERNFETPLHAEGVGKYREPLEMMRLAPSAGNAQPWRVLMSDEKIHFYDAVHSGFSAIDMGIGLCHFEMVCKELNIAGQFEVLKGIDIHENSKNRYVVSWVAG